MTTGLSSAVPDQVSSGATSHSSCASRDFAGAYGGTLRERLYFSSWDREAMSLVA